MNPYADKAYAQIGSGLSGQSLGNMDYAQKAAVPQRTDAVSSTVSRLYDHANVLGELCARADAIASSLDSPEPQAKGEGDNPRPPSLVGSLQFLDMRINSLTNDLRRHLNRIEAALG